MNVGVVVRMAGLAVIAGCDSCSVMDGKSNEEARTHNVLKLRHYVFKKKKKREEMYLSTNLKSSNTE